MISARSLHTATRLAGGRILVAGGQSSGGAVVPLAEIYDPSTGQWTATGTLSRRFKSCLPDQLTARFTLGLRGTTGLVISDDAAPRSRSATRVEEARDRCFGRDPACA